MIANDGKGVNYELNPNDNSASIIQSPYASGDIFVPRYMNFQNRLFTITTIKKNSFHSNSNIKSVLFANDSDLRIIEEDAFYDSSIERIQIPSSVISIEQSAFCYCKNLTTIIIPPDSKITVISSSLFSSSSIKSFNLPPGVVRIEENAFSCSSLETLNIPENSQLNCICSEVFCSAKIKHLFIPPLLQELKDGWCRETIELKSIVVSPRNQFFMLIDNKILLGKSDQTKQDYDVLCFAVRSIENVVVPSFVKTIQSYSFSYCQNLKNVVFPHDSKLQSIQRAAFNESSLISIKIPNNVSIIEGYAFESCFKLTKFSFPKNNKIKIINECLFRGTSIENISIPSSVTQINFRAFSDCRKLKVIDFPPDIKLKQLQNYVFYYNTELEAIKIPSTVKEIGSCLLTGCSKLKRVELSTNSQLNFISSLMFFGSGLEYAIIPPNYDSIYNEAFALCDKLKSVEFLGDSISISDLVFDECPKLMALSFPKAKKIEIDGDTFNDKPENLLIFTSPEANIKLV